MKYQKDNHILQHGESRYFPCFMNVLTSGDYEMLNLRGHPYCGLAATDL